jgi:hypothetical protein
VRDEMLTLIDGTTLDRDSILGFISLFTVPDNPVPGAKLNRLWTAEGLDAALIPDARKAADVFAQACRQVETRKAGTNPAHRTEVKVDEVSNGPDERVYQITRMVRDQTNQVIDHPKAMTLALDKPAADGGADAANCIKVIPRDPATFGALKGLADSVVAYYDKNLTTVPGQKIRNAVRDYMKILGAENLRREVSTSSRCPALTRWSHWSGCWTSSTKAQPTCTSSRSRTPRRWSRWSPATTR